MSDESINTLVSIGFDLNQSIQALANAGGNLERAVDLLLGGVSATAAGGHDDEPRIIHSDVYQYNDSIGRSACTSIALTMAHRSLIQLRHGVPLENVLDSSFLGESIRSGIETYCEFKNNRISQVEHSSTEELLSECSQKFESMRLLEGYPRQGILSSANSQGNPVGLTSILSQCQEDATNPQSCTAVTITKPPETILVLLPPRSSTNGYSYVLMDSHPRPTQLGPHHPPGSYALFHSSLDGLVQSLMEIFPAVDLGSDVPEMMAMMYNSFDVYPFEQES